MICISIGNRNIIEGVNALLPEMVEIRYDLISDRPDTLDHFIDNRIKRIATCRPGKLNDHDRSEILRSSLEFGADYVDIEYESKPAYTGDMLMACKKYDASLIISYHNYSGTPDLKTLTDILDRSYEMGADIVKLACNVHEKKDAANLLSLYNEERPKVVIGMGALGKITRVAALLLGAPFSFAAFSGEDLTAPGQFTYDEMKTMLKKIRNT